MIGFKQKRCSGHEKKELKRNKKKGGKTPENTIQNQITNVKSSPNIKNNTNSKKTIDLRTNQINKSFMKIINFKMNYLKSKLNLKW